MWPEVTDPQKFVYEDVAIAAYLLVRLCDLSGWKDGRVPAAAQGFSVLSVNVGLP